MAGLTIVIVREDLLGHAHPMTPATMNWTLQAENNSMYNTPSTYAWYLAGLVFEHLLKLGGLEVMAEVNERKAQKLYDFIDQSDFYTNPIAPHQRSWMNVSFFLADEGLNTAFLQESAQAGLTNLKGHRIFGGMRASIYNAMPEAGVDALIKFMDQFARKHNL